MGGGTIRDGEGEGEGEGEEGEGEEVKNVYFRLDLFNGYVTKEIDFGSKVIFKNIFHDKNV